MDLLIIEDDNALGKAIHQGLSEAGHECRWVKSGRLGYDQAYGARPLRRFIAHDIETRIARALVAGDLTDGSTILVDARDGEIVVDFRPAREPAEAGRR